MSSEFNEHSRQKLVGMRDVNRRNLLEAAATDPVLYGYIVRQNKRIEVELERRRNNDDNNKTRTVGPTDIYQREAP